MAHEVQDLFRFPAVERRLFREASHTTLRNRPTTSIAVSMDCI